MASGMIELVNPVGERPEQQNVAAKPLRDLRGKRIGFRTDHYWKTYDVFVARVQELLRERREASEFVEFKNFPTTGGRAVGPDASPEFLAFADQADAVILGLCA